MSIDGDLRPLFRSRLRVGWDWQSVETGGTGRGIPDANWCSQSTEGWCEMKVTTGLAVDLRPEQVAWLTRRAMHGGRVHVAVRRKASAGPRRGAALDELWLLDGAHAKLLKETGLRPHLWEGCPRSPLLGHWPGGPARWDWEAVGEALRGPLARPPAPGYGALAR